MRPPLPSVVDCSASGTLATPRTSGVNAVDARAAVFDAEEAVYEALADLFRHMPFCSPESAVVSRHQHELRTLLTRQRHERSRAFQEAHGRRH